jgi:hypothetical protein
MKVNGLIDNPLWYGIACKCDHSSVETEYPIKSCLHCKFEEQEKSIPSENFKIKVEKIDKDGNIKIENKTIKEINIVRGKIYQDVIGWEF